MTNSTPFGARKQADAAISHDRVASAMRRVADLWPEGLGAVPGSYEVAMKQDADTLRALAAYWKEANPDAES